MATGDLVSAPCRLNDTERLLLDLFIDKQFQIVPKKIGGLEFWQTLSKPHSQLDLFELRPTLLAANQVLPDPARIVRRQPTMTIGR